MEETLLKIFVQTGIIINDKDERIFLDSLQFVNIVVEIENVFLIIVEEEYLSLEKLKSFNNYMSMINQYIGE